MGTMKVMMFDGIVRTLSDVKHAPKLRSLIFLGPLNALGYDFSTKNNIMNINKDSLVTMKG